MSFTVETDGRLPDGTPLRDAVEEVDAAGGPAGTSSTAPTPTHLAPGLDDGPARTRSLGVRPNASRMCHAELDDAEVLDEGDPTELRAA